MRKKMLNSSLMNRILLFFLIFVSPTFTHSINSTEEETIVEEFILCRYCGSDVTISNFFLNKISPYALSASNQTFYNHQKILVQTLENSLGVQFKVVIVRKAHCAAINIRWSDHFSWFPGYKWRICLCSNSKCTRHLGWMFEPADSPEINSLHAPSDQGFYALIVGDILTESHVNSLLMTEKHHTEF
ncbi:protein cereblon homolog [Contarinia nasturtii]|uniref:protein cereblon homolog n=1 Tax=Contarinia nasturtii TaxID=265458 RepID=UPI0012D3F01D|nr:protein cereblon homolog [Contarinia nasturtii]